MTVRHPLTRRQFTRNLLACIALLIIAAFAVVTAPSAGHRPVPLLICQTFGPKCAKAMYVAWCESGLRADAVSPTRDVGIYQLNFSAHRKRGESFASFKKRMSVPRRNVEFAHRLSRGGRDWTPWRFSQDCWGRM